MSEVLVYLYAVGDAALADSDAVRSLVGVDGTPTRVVVDGGLGAVVSSVDAERFGEEPLRRSLEDLTWLERVARAHHTVVDAVGQAHPIAPVRLATVYLDDGSVRALLTEEATAFARAVDRIRGRREWGVKGYAAPEQDEQAPPEADGTGPGTAYLLRRRTARDHARRVQEQATEEAEQVHRTLTTFAAASRRYPPQDPRLTGRSEAMVLNAAYLVDEDGTQALRDAVTAHPGPTVALELTGPWAPYSFATLEQP